MTLIELQERLHELNRLHRAQDPNVESQKRSLIDDLYPHQLTVVWSEDYSEFVVADNEEEKTSLEDVDVDDETAAIERLGDQAYYII